MTIFVFSDLKSKLFIQRLSTRLVSQEATKPSNSSSDYTNLRNLKGVRRPDVIRSSPIHVIEREGKLNCESAMC